MLANKFYEVYMYNASNVHLPIRAGERSMRQKLFRPVRQVWKINMEWMINAVRTSLSFTVFPPSLASWGERVGSEILYFTPGFSPLQLKRTTTGGG